MEQGILLFAHGARDPQWALPFEAVAARLRVQAPDTPVELAFLEFMTPDLLEAGERLAAAGCRHVNVVPLFLGAGGHVRKDLPVLLQQLSALHPDVSWMLNPAVGETAEVVEAMAASALRMSAAR
ncbi:CbiX/SirB N-terminal domain-containing protein [Aquabacterium sp. A7-Y]|uniref:sirohydrochlorin chelatase n=1 Tax=Aquabacterium sp. A7-Y TaxID=1349605 RepID=UPI00223CB717|nr:CbiX/SirB N-terminal domain-containing protein [Aquabacterium sp. A7-Y]MCW7537862.1 CbiX/SirB N-terminal domain-containing protein [Aquabacterium sp. A7-Y]